MKESSKNNGTKITIIVSTLLLAVLAFFSYQNHIKNKESQSILLEEKLQIQADLDTKIVELNEAIDSNTTMEQELVQARDKIVSFRDSVKNLKTLNFRIIRRYKDKLAILELTNKKLLAISDSLKIANYNISIERDSANATVERQVGTIDTQRQENENLSTQNTDLQKIVNEGSALQVGNVSVIAMKERRNGELKETSRAKRTDAFRISFIVRENSIANSGVRKAHVIIKNAEGDVLSSTETFTDTNGVNLAYSETTDVMYENKDIEVIVVKTITEEKLEKGNYYISIYLENNLLGSTKIYLK